MGDNFGMFFVQFKIRERILGINKLQLSSITLNLNPMSLDQSIDFSPPEGDKKSRANQKEPQEAYEAIDVATEEALGVMEKLDTNQALQALTEAYVDFKTTPELGEYDHLVGALEQAIEAGVKTYEGKSIEVFKAEIISREEQALRNEAQHSLNFLRLDPNGPYQILEYVVERANEKGISLEEASAAVASRNLKKIKDEVDDREPLSEEVILTLSAEDLGRAIKKLDLKTAQRAAGRLLLDSANAAGPGHPAYDVLLALLQDPKVSDRRKRLVVFSIAPLKVGPEGGRSFMDKSHYKILEAVRENNATAPALKNDIGILLDRVKSVVVMSTLDPN